MPLGAAVCLQAAQERQKALNQVTNVLQQKIRALQSSQPSSSGGVS
jgi:cell division protein ZapA (FtsZ GTPase activity inhibitor)